MRLALPCRQVLAYAVVMPALGMVACSANPTVDPHQRPQSGTHPSSTQDVQSDRERIQRLATTARELTRFELSRLPSFRQAQLTSPCAALSWGDFYCLGLGFMPDRPDYRALLAVETATPSGDLAFSDWVAHRVTLPRMERLRLQAQETDEAILGLPKARTIASG